jgi:hypothetical protein
MRHKNASSTFPVICDKGQQNPQKEPNVKSLYFTEIIINFHKDTNTKNDNN